MFCPVKAIGKTVATERRMERDMKYITKNLDFQLDKRSVVTLGKFDGVHKGHSKLINRVLEIGKEGYETVVFTFDVSPLVRLGTRIKRTILTNEERRILLERREWNAWWSVRSFRKLSGWSRRILSGRFWLNSCVPHM